MGQQQLLLLILAAIIVGIAIVVGINMFGENAIQANQDAVMQDCLTIASRAQGWYRRPTQMGGGGNSFLGLTPAMLNFDATNENGSYSFGVADQLLTITGVGKELYNGADTVSVVISVAVDSVKTESINGTTIP